MTLNRKPVELLNLKSWLLHMFFNFLIHKNHYVPASYLLHKIKLFLMILKFSKRLLIHDAYSQETHTFVLLLLGQLCIFPYTIVFINSIHVISRKVQNIFNSDLQFYPDWEAKARKCQTFQKISQCLGSSFKSSITIIYSLY